MLFVEPLNPEVGESQKMTQINITSVVVCVIQKGLQYCFCKAKTWSVSRSNGKSVHPSLNGFNKQSTLDKFLAKKVMMDLDFWSRGSCKISRSCSINGSFTAFDQL